MPGPYLATRLGLSLGMRTVLVNTRVGQVAFTELSNTGLPVAALMYGLFRGSESLAPLIDRIEGADVVVVHQPGHSGAPELEEVGVTPFAQAVAVGLQTLLADRRVVFAGESLGGLIGLAVGSYKIPCLHSVMAFDPFFTTRKLWPIHRQTADAWPIPSAPLLLDRIFGAGSGPAEERDYRPVLQNLVVPATVVTGDIPLFPERDLDRSPCLMDEEDCAAVDASSASLIRLRGGHRLLEECPDPCAELLNQLIRRTR